jgi:hypothetical protein
MLKSIFRSTCLLALATLSLAEIAPALAGENSCTGDVSNCRACQYRAKDLAQTPPAALVPTPEQPAPLVEPPPVQTPAAPPETMPVPPRRGRG